MAIDCYARFKTTYRQAKADGLSDTVATAAAQSAMDACLAQQNARPSTVAAPLTTVQSGRTIDPGPTKPVPEKK